MAKAGAPSVVAVGSGRSAQTRQRLVRAAIETLRSDGYARASARTIAQRAGLNQSLIFYHFGSVADLLLAALDAVSEERHRVYSTEVTGAASAGELVDAAEGIFRKDLEAGYTTVLVEMITGSAATPGLGPAVAARIRPWRDFAESTLEAYLGGSPLGGVLPAEEVAHAVVALYLGLEMLSHLEGDAGPALALFARAKQVAALSESLPRSAIAKEQR